MTRSSLTSICAAAAAFAVLSARAAMAGDYALAAGASAAISSSVTYGTMSISGSLAVKGGAVVTATETALGGNAGDSAGISVSGSGSKLDSQKVTIGGASGGTGKITATNGGVVVIGKTASDTNLLAVASGAVPAQGNVIDVLELGSGTHSISRLSNASSYPARIRLVESGAKFSVRSSSSAQWKTSFASGNWILDANYPAEIRLDCPPNHYLTGGSARIATTGSGAFHVVGGSATYNAAVTFGNTGGLVVDSGFSISFTKDKADMSGLRGPLTINGTLNAANATVYGDGLVVGANGAITTSATQDFVFGSGDANGSLSAAIPSSNRVVKVGSGTLNVTGASSAGRLTVSNGTVKVSAAFAVGTLELEDGAAIVVANDVDFAPGALVLHGSAAITTLGTGRFIIDSDSPCAIAHPSLGGSFVKRGSGTTLIYEPQSMPDVLHVAEGGVVFSAYGLSQKFMRWTFSKAGTGPNPLQFSKIWVFGTDGSHVATGLTAANDNTTANLAAGKVCWEYNSGKTNISNQTSAWYEQKGIVYKMFSDALTSDRNHYPRLASPVIDPENSDSWLSIALRRKDGEANATGYNMRIANHIYSPSSWTVEVSDDGRNWTQVDARTDVMPTKTDWWSFYDGKISASAEDYPSEFFLFKSGGLEPDSTKAVKLQVDSGTTADLTAFTVAPQRIGGLVVDMAHGGGTILGGGIASVGTLTILNASQGFEAGKPLPIKLDGVAGADNLRNWTIVVDGTPTQGRVRLDANGNPVVYVISTVIYFK